MPRAWVFIHLPKTAGTSFRSAIEATGTVPVHRDFPREAACSELIRERVHRGTVGTPGERRAALLGELDAGPRCLLTGHFRLADYPLAASPERVVTIVRDPVERTLSHYEFLSLMDGPIDLDRFIADPKFANLQSEWLRGVELEQLGLVGVTAELDSFVRAFGRLSGIRAATRQANVLDPGGDRVGRYPARVIAAIRERNAEDASLYERALAMQEEIRRPRFSIVMPTFNSGARHLREAIRSVTSQGGDDWELRIADDGSTEAGVRETLEGHAEDPRISIQYLGRNEGISGATNRALEGCGGDFVVMLDHDDLLLPGALEALRAALRTSPEAEILYSDQTKIDGHGKTTDVFLKPDWSPAYAVGVMYIGHLLVVRRDLIERAGRCDPAFDGAQDYEWFLRLSEIAERIVHVPEPLYAWRAVEGSIASDPDAKPQAASLQLRAAREHLDRIGAGDLDLEPHPEFAHRLRLAPRPGVPQPTPTVSVVIPTRDQGQYLRRCLDSIETGSYPRLELICVDGGSTEPEALAALERPGVTVIAGADDPFNFSAACNAGVEAAAGEVVILLNNDTEVLDRDWVEQLLLHLRLPGVGAVGPLLTYADGSVQHAGVAIGPRGSADHVMVGFDADSEGIAGALCCAREVAAVTAAALCVRRDTYLELGGMDTDFATHYQDVDFCLRLRERGERVLFAPRPRLIHHEMTSRGDTYDFIDRALLIERHRDVQLGRDPYYHRRFNREPADYTVVGQDPQ